MKVDHYKFSSESLSSRRDSPSDSVNEELNSSEHLKNEKPPAPQTVSDEDVEAVIRDVVESCRRLLTPSNLKWALGRLDESDADRIAGSSTSPSTSRLSNLLISDGASQNLEQSEKSILSPSKRSLSENNLQNYLTPDLSQPNLLASDVTRAIGFLLNSVQIFPQILTYSTPDPSPPRANEIFVSPNQDSSSTFFDTSAESSDADSHYAPALVVPVPKQLERLVQTGDPPPPSIDEDSKYIE